MTSPHSFGIFRLTDPPGLKAILECKAKEAFHPHPDLPIYTVGFTSWLASMAYQYPYLRCTTGCRQGARPDERHFVGDCRPALRAVDVSSTLSVKRCYPALLPFHRHSFISHASVFVIHTHACTILITSYIYSCYCYVVLHC